jgi:hypothetical protein
VYRRSRSCRLTRSLCGGGHAEEKRARIPACHLCASKAGTNPKYVNSTAACTTNHRRQAGGSGRKLRIVESAHAREGGAGRGRVWMTTKLPIAGEYVRLTCPQGKAALNQQGRLVLPTFLLAEIWRMGWEGRKREPAGWREEVGWGVGEQRPFEWSHGEAPSHSNGVVHCARLGTSSTHVCSCTDQGTAAAGHGLIQEGRGPAQRKCRPGLGNAQGIQGQLNAPKTARMVDEVELRALQQRALEQGDKAPGHRGPQVVRGDWKGLHWLPR